MAKTSPIFKEVEVKKVEKQKVGVILELNMEEARLLTFLVGKSNAEVGSVDLGTSLYSVLQKECGCYSHKANLVDPPYNCDYNLKATQYILFGPKNNDRRDSKLA